MVYISQDIYDIKQLSYDLLFRTRTVLFVWCFHAIMCNVNLYRSTIHSLQTRVPEIRILARVFVILCNSGWKWNSRGGFDFAQSSVLEHRKH